MSPFFTPVPEWKATVRKRVQEHRRLKLADGSTMGGQGSNGGGTRESGMGSQRAAAEAGANLAAVRPLATARYAPPSVEPSPRERLLSNIAAHRSRCLKAFILCAVLAFVLLIVMLFPGGDARMSEGGWPPPPGVEER